MTDNIKLLIVDDEVKFLDSIAQRLELRGFGVTKAKSGLEAIEAAKTGKFDLALLDLKMPGMDGTQVLEILKKEHKYLEVIILTGHGSVDSAVECTKLGAFSYLPKPYELDMLLEKLKEAFQERLRKKFETDQARMDKIAKLAAGSSPLGILRELRKLDDEVK
ncbi:MAG: response regulator [candidate division Zixibacteria bacterium HGW-Zixibacteria-1]|nr:MAG: response regulator [candidate division Zixibacteria bacterium HGW-Zixibacteria-1]